MSLKYLDFDHSEDTEGLCTVTLTLTGSPTFTEAFMARFASLD
jgi:hypothetical protein